ncbi:hypothetical protein AA313_de0206168 [Arthrobotrys entomopaga]|nr:hypothetical protein AA313_de0206168 [Arthrobotrys entomopaga]
MHNAQKSMDFVGRTFPSDLKNFLLYLFNGPAVGVRTMEEMFSMISFQVIQNFDSSLHQNDVLESQLSKELENGRLVRLLCKFGFINERPEFAHDHKWSETGDRYLIMLFRDYVFHQVDENGNPVLDLVHVLTCLNKLDAGTDEKIMLVSRDEQNCLIVTFREYANRIPKYTTSTTSTTSSSSSSSPSSSSCCTTNDVPESANNGTISPSANFATPSSAKYATAFSALYTTTPTSNYATEP